MNTKKNSPVRKQVEALSPEMLASLKALLSIPSVKDMPTASSSAPFGEGIGRALKYSLELGEKLSFKSVNLDGYCGYIEYAPCGPDAEQLGIMCHLDVVPIGEGWTHDPFGAEIVEGRLYARGALDDKGPVISTLYGLAIAKKLAGEGNFKRNVRIILGCDEESGWECMDYYKKCEKLPALAFSPDASYPLVNSEMNIFHVTFAHKFASKLRFSAGERANVVPGKAEAFVPLAPADILPVAELMLGSAFPFDVKEAPGGSSILVSGVSAHGSLPDDGKNAMLALLSVLAQLPLAAEDKYTLNLLYNAFKLDTHGQGFGLDETDASGRLTLNPGVISWDENGLNALTLDIRAPLTLDEATITARLKCKLGEFEITSANFTAGHYVDPSSELVTKLMKIYRDLSGDTNTQPLAIGGGTYARCMPGIAVAFGPEFPDKEAPVHMPDEYLTLEDFMFNTEATAEAILALATCAMTR